jgi:DNA-binding transcriptional LysR family regulator
MPAVRSFLAAHPGLTIDLELDDALVAEGVDVAVRIGELAGSRLVAMKLGEYRRLLVAGTICGTPSRSLARTTWPRTPASSTQDGVRPTGGRSRAGRRPRYDHGRRQFSLEQFSSRARRYPLGVGNWLCAGTADRRRS